MATRYGKRIVTDGLVLCLDAADNISAPHNDLPVKQGCVTWLDGADDDVFSYSSGTLVSQWRDKSGNDNHVSQSTTSSQPTRNRTLNSKSVVDFDGSDDSLSSSNSLALYSGYTMFAVTLTDAFSSDAGLISIQDRLEQGITIHTGGYAYFYFGSGGYNTTQSVAASTSYILSKVWTGATSGNRISYKDGTQGYSTGTMASSHSTGVLRLGQQTTYYNGYIAEVVIYNRELSQDEITKVHNYLQNKWNIKVSDSKWYDRTANGYTFGKGGDPIFSKTNKGHFDFDGSDDRMDMPGSDRITYSTTEAWTHEIVIDPGSNGIATSWNGIFGDYLNNGGYWFFHNGGQLSWYDAIISNSGKLWYTGLYLGTDIPYDTITHITITHDGSAGLKVFINGVQQRSTTRTFETSYSGSIKIIGAGDSNRYGTSKIYLFRNYSKQLSDAEILQNYNATKGRYTALGTASNPAESAVQILASDSTSPNGLYWIKPSGYSGSAQLIYCDMSRGGWMLVASNDASDTTIPGGTSRNSLTYALNRNGTNGALGTPDPNKDYIIGNIIDSLSFSSVKVIGWGRGSTNGTYFWDGDQNNLGSSIIAEWNLSSSGSSRRTEVVARANVTLSGSTTLHGSASYFVLDAVACDSGLNANSNQSTVGGAGVANSSGDPSNGTYLGHGSSEGSYEGWYISGGSHSNSQGYTTWVK